MNARLEAVRDHENSLSATSAYSSIGLAIAFQVLDRVGNTERVYDITDYILTNCPRWDGSERWTIDDWIEDFYATRVQVEEDELHFAEYWVDEPEDERWNTLP